MPWLSAFLKEMYISAKERTAIELRVLVHCVWIAGVYDQVNLGSLACMEEICRRISQLVEAYSVDPNRPNWTAVKHVISSSSVGNVVPNSLRSYAHRLVKDEVEVENLRQKASQFGGSAPSSVAEGLPGAKGEGK